ncbi:hypothetical protein AB0J71_24270 [Nonomuraea sp. NPDC049637]|uniref:MmyB family transcriptional regulator n=1 Tax=Nonomuraea sp. NPDC049637 TaxID=3154356 RepID=UPI0034452E45
MPATRTLDPQPSQREASAGLDFKATEVSRCPADARLDRLVRELRATSGAFAHHWAAQTTGAPHTTDAKTIRHPQVGDILLDCDVLVVPGADLRLVTYTAAAGSAEDGKLDLLRVTGGRLAATRR